MFAVRPPVRAVLAALEREGEIEPACESLARQYANSLREELIVFADRTPEGNFVDTLPAQIARWKTSSDRCSWSMVLETQSIKDEYEAKRLTDAKPCPTCGRTTPARTEWMCRIAAVVMGIGKMGS